VAGVNPGAVRSRSLGTARVSGKQFPLEIVDVLWQEDLSNVTTVQRAIRLDSLPGQGGAKIVLMHRWDPEQAMALNFYISFSGIVTFKGAGQIHEVARRMPAERMLVETDSPYLAPVPHRGKSNHPAWVRFVAESVARLRGETVETVAAVTTANYLRLFGLNSG